MAASRVEDPMSGLLTGMKGLETGIFAKHNQTMKDMKSTPPNRSRDNSFTSAGSGRIAAQGNDNTRKPSFPASDAQAGRPQPTPYAGQTASRPPQQRPASSFQDAQFDNLLAGAGFSKAGR